MKALPLLLLLLPIQAQAWPVPNWRDPKVQADVERAVLEGQDPYLVLAHIASETGDWVLGGDGKVFGWQDALNTFVRSGTGDYGRHQISCGTWKKVQTLWEEGRWYSDFPKEARIRRCVDLYKDEINRAAYHYTLRLIQRTRAKGRWKREIGGVPWWIGFYQSGYNRPKISYVRRVAEHRRRFRNWRWERRPPRGPSPES